jgi:hypothetical protein
MGAFIIQLYHKKLRPVVSGGAPGSGVNKMVNHLLFLLLTAVLPSL